ncbi:hypothetical protein BJX62DRAFT_244721 [Aspergillus germanicus]
MKLTLSALLLLPLGALGTSQWCTIINASSKVNCRAGPSLNSKVIRQLTPGKDYYFQCYKRGDCYNENCTWDRHIAPGVTDCYVNGYLTDNHCTMGMNPRCSSSLLALS